jgi:hypothetical protein
MPVVVRARTIDGHTLGACARSCYDADADTKCSCICGGENHGQGRIFAMAGARELSEQFSHSDVHPEADQLVIPGTV